MKLQLHEAFVLMTKLALRGEPDAVKTLARSTIERAERAYRFALADELRKAIGEPPRYIKGHPIMRIWLDEPREAQEP